MSKQIMSEQNLLNENLSGNDQMFDEDELIGDVHFGESNTNLNSNEESNEDISKYTLVDNLDEDDIIESQRYALFSFLSPEGIMNCNIRALKFRGAFPTLDKAKNYVDKLKTKDEYFKIFVGEQGKWMEFDPPEDKVEDEIAEDPKAQKIIDARRKQRANKINEMAGRFKNQHDKNQSTDGKKERVNENVKASASETAGQQKLNKRKNKKQNVMVDSGRGREMNKLKESMRKKLQKRREAEKLKREDLEIVSGKIDNTDEKIKVVNKAIDDLHNDKQQKDEVDKKINDIRNLMKKRKMD